MIMIFFFSYLMLTMNSFNPFYFSILMILASIAISIFLWLKIFSVLLMFVMILMFSSGMMMIFCYSSSFINYEKNYLYIKKFIVLVILVIMLSMNFLMNNDVMGFENSNLMFLIYFLFFILMMIMMVLFFMNKLMMNPAKSFMNYY